MKQMKVLKQAIRALARQVGSAPATPEGDARDDAGDGADWQARKQARRLLKQQQRNAAPGARAGRGPGAAGALLAAAAMGSTPLAGAAGAPGATSGLPPAAGPAGIVEDSVVYKQTSRGPLQLHVVQPATPAPPGGRACVVFFHGGGWRRGSTNQFRLFSMLLAQHGVVGMSAEYRLLETEERLIPTEAIEDARSAMRFVRRNAARLGCDPARIGAGGGSAGAHLAMMTVKAPLDDPQDDRSIDPRPAALIVLNGPVNFDAYVAPVPLDERRRFAPFYLIDRTWPPTLMMHGTRDKVIPFAQVTAFRDKAAQLGVEVRLVAFDGRGHGFFNKGKGQPGDWERAGGEMLAFLRSLGWIAAGQ